MEPSTPTRYTVLASSGESKPSVEYYNIQSLQNSSLLETKHRRLLIFPGILATTIVSIVLLIGNRQRWTIQDKYYDSIANKRATVQVIVQILAAMCALGQVSTIRTLLNYFTRQQLAQQAVTLDHLNFYSCLLTSQINWSLPKFNLLTVLVTSVIFVLPSAIWVGALTPVTDILPIQEPFLLAIPVYSNDTADMWRDQSWFTRKNESLIKQTSFGLFTYGPVRDRFSFFLDSGSTASSLDGQPQLNKKSDNSNYTYIGRSYGVGSSVGIVDAVMLRAHRRLMRYKFFETGYDTQWACIYNNTPAFGLKEKGSGIFDTYKKTIVKRYLVADLNITNHNRPQIVAANSWQWRGDKDCTRRNHTKPDMYITILATGDYAELNATQCAAVVTPTVFSVDVNVIDRLITVSPDNTKDAQNIDCSGIQANRAVDTLSAMSMISTTSYTSAVGNMLQSNIFNVFQQHTNETKEQMTLRGLSESLAALADQYLFSEAGAQLMIANDTILVPVSASARVLRTGQSAFVYAVFAINFFILLVLMLEVVRTKFWCDLPRWDFTDVKSAIVAGAFGGTELVHRVRMSDEAWTGGSSSRAMGNIRVRLMGMTGSVGLKVEETT